MSSHIKRIIIEEYEDGSYSLYNQTSNREVCGLINEKYLIQALLIELDLKTKTSQEKEQSSGELVK